MKSNRVLLKKYDTLQFYLFSYVDILQYQIPLFESFTYTKITHFSIIQKQIQIIFLGLKGPGWGLRNLMCPIYVLRTLGRLNLGLLAVKAQLQFWLQQLKRNKKPPTFIEGLHYNRFKLMYSPIRESPT